jgi:hypothetical protein
MSPAEAGLEVGLKRVMPEKGTEQLTATQCQRRDKRPPQPPSAVLTDPLQSDIVR